MTESNCPPVKSITVSTKGSLGLGSLDAWVGHQIRALAPRFLEVIRIYSYAFFPQILGHLVTFTLGVLII